MEMCWSSTKVLFSSFMETRFTFCDFQTPDEVQRPSDVSPGRQVEQKSGERYIYFFHLEFNASLKTKRRKQQCGKRAFLNPNGFIHEARREELFRIFINVLKRPRVTETQSGHKIGRKLITANIKGIT